MNSQLPLVLIINKGSSSSSSVNRSMIVDKLEFGVTTDLLKETIIKNMDMSDLVTSKPNYKDEDDFINENKMTGAELIEFQKKQLEQLEHKEQMKNVIDAETLKQEERRKEMEFQQNLKKIQEVEKIKEELAPEPAEGPDTTTIVFRYPNSDLRKSRRFMRKDLVKSLYDFVKTLGSDIFEESNEFELIQPFPMKIYDDMNKTLEEEKLISNAVIQIREI